MEDFFWTGSGDGPPNYIQPKDESNSEGSNRAIGGTIIKTATVLATVYVDGSMETLDPLCTFDCDNIEYNSVEATIPSDRRYWLLTVVGGFFGPQDFPILEEKLAKLYRIAFTRQQARHLGINGYNKTNNNSTSTIERIKRSVIQPTKVLLSINDTVSQREIVPTSNDSSASQSQKYHRTKRVQRDIYETTKINTNSSLGYDSSPVNEQNKANANYQKILIDRRNSNRRKVTVLIHNVTQLTDEDITKSIDLNIKR